MNTDLAPLSYTTGAQRHEAKERKDQIGRAWNYTRGAYSDTLRRDKNGVNDNIKFDLAELVMDTLTAALAGREIRIKASSEEAQQWLNLVWKKNRKMTLMAEQSDNGIVGGHVFWRLYPPDGDHDEPQIVGIDPQLVDMYVDPHNRHNVLGYCITYPIGEGVNYRQRIQQDSTKRWWIIDEQQEKDGSAWHQASGTEPEKWPYKWCPIVAHPNMTQSNRAWGRANLTKNVLNLQIQLNRVLTNINRIIRIFAHPRTIVIGADSDQMKWTNGEIGAILTITVKGASIETQEMTTDLRAVINAWHEFLTTYFTMTKVPPLVLGIAMGLNLGQLSGVAMKVQFAPLTQVTQKRQQTFGEGIEEVCEHLLEMAPDAALKGQTVEVLFAPIVPQDILEAAQTADIMYNKLDMDRETVLTQLDQEETETIYEQPDTNTNPRQPAANRSASTRRVVNRNAASRAASSREPVLIGDTE